MEDWWEGIQALRPVETMTARLLIVPLRHPIELSCKMEPLLGGVHCDSDTAILISGICNDAVYPPRNNRRIVHCCFYN